MSGRDLGRGTECHELKQTDYSHFISWAESHNTGPIILRVLSMACSLRFLESPATYFYVKIFH